jgi:hypothetical protein
VNLKDQKRALFSELCAIIRRFEAIECTVSVHGQEYPDGKVRHTVITGPKAPCAKAVSK